MMLQIMEIKDFNAPELDVYARLTENQLLNRHEPEKGIFIAESPKVIERALDGGCIPLSFLVEHRHLESQARELLERCPEVPVYTAEFDILTQLTGFKLTRGMLCAMRRPALPTVEQICAGARRGVVLEEDGIRINWQDGSGRYSVNAALSGVTRTDTGRTWAWLNDPQALTVGERAPLYLAVYDDGEGVTSAALPDSFFDVAYLNQYDRAYAVAITLEA